MSLRTLGAASDLKNETLEDLSIECRRGRQPAYHDGSTMVLNQKCVRLGALDLTHTKLTNEASKPLPEWALLQSGDILVTSTGTGTVGRAAMVPRDFAARATIDTHITLVRPDMARVEPEYLTYWLISQNRQLEILAGGSTGQSELRAKDLAACHVPLPGLTDQRRIVDELDSVRRRVDAVDATTTDIMARLRTFELAILETEYSRWEADSEISDLGEVFVGATPSRRNPSLWNGDVPWVSSGEIAFCRIASTREAITEKGLGRRETRLHPPGTVMLAMIGEGRTRGQAAILDVASAHNQNSAAIRLGDRMLPEFLYHWFRRAYVVTRRLGAGTQQAALNGKIVKAMKVPCPSLAEQERAVARIEAAQVRVAQIVAHVEGASQRAESLWRSSLARAFAASNVDSHRPRGVNQTISHQYSGEAL